MSGSTYLKDFKDWFLQPFKKESKSVWRVFALCFLTAFIFWVFNSLNKSYTTIINFPIQVVYDDENYIPVKELPKSTKMEVSGFGWDLIRWSFGFGKEPMNLIPNSYDRNSVSLNSYRNAIMDQLGQVQLNKFIGDSLYLDFDRKVSKKLALRIDTSTINFKEGFALKDSIIIVPDSIELTGPKSILTNLKDNFLVHLPEKKISKDFDEQIALDFKSNPMVSLGREDINVFFRVHEFVIAEKNLSIRAKGFEADSISFQPAQITVRYKIPKSELDQDSLIAIASYSDFNASDSTVKIRLGGLNDKIRNLHISPDSAKVKVY